ncbi:MAG TPA: undecaprenyl-diphosphate phosphatase, partial [Bryobacteraceae bacterium]|nr:undecaprenyl-diphosphate phosphatase [Bryobacteraceae bacterium]
MPLAHVIILAIIQGLTEFLPVSSTAHLYLTSWLLGWKTESLEFDISLHLGTLLALLLYFLPDWIQIISQAFGMHAGYDEQLKQNHMLLWLLLLGSIPVGVAGLLFHRQAESSWRNPYVMGGMLVAVGLFLWMAERSGRHVRELGSLHAPDSLVIGLSQALAIVPGTSRSGVTIGTGLLRDLTRETAARFSFLLSTPAIGAAAAKAIYDTHKQTGLHGILNTAFLVGVAVSTLTGCAVIAWFLHYLRHASLRPFVYY